MSRGPLVEERGRVAECVSGVVVGDVTGLTSFTCRRCRRCYLLQPIGSWCGPWALRLLVDPFWWVW